MPKFVLDAYDDLESLPGDWYLPGLEALPGTYWGFLKALTSVYLAIVVVFQAKG